jgi:anti-sigma regulatory factor (Ser/Thr protein kinase)
VVNLEHLIGSNEGGLVLPIEPVRGRLGIIRCQLSSFLHKHGIDDDTWLLVANELVANAIDASAGGGPSEGPRTRPSIEGPAILLSLVADRLRVELTVANVGPAVTLPDPLSMPSATAARGRGLPLVRALVDGIDVRRVEGVNVVSCWRALPAGPDR